MSSEGCDRLKPTAKENLDSAIFDTARALARQKRMNELRIIFVQQRILVALERGFDPHPNDYGFAEMLDRCEELATEIIIREERNDATERIDILMQHKIVAMRMDDEKRRQCEQQNNS